MNVWSLFSAAPAKLRQVMLQGILTQCCFPQLSYISANVHKLIRIDFLSALPTELAFRILCYLDTTSLCKAAQVSQRWRSLADDDVVWHKMCEQHIDRKCTKCGWGLPLLERKRLRASKRQIQLRATGQGLNEWSPNITPFPESHPEDNLGLVSNPNRSLLESAQYQQLAIAPAEHAATPQESYTRSPALEDSNFKPRLRPWKDVYKDRFKVGSNWRHGRYSIKTFKGHTNGVMCLQFDEHILATGSYDATIKIWDIQTGKELRTLSGHASGVRCLQFDDNKLISGSIDTTIKVWNWRTGECQSTYMRHRGGVIGLHFDSTLLASGSTDKTIRIWNFNDQSTFALRGHEDWVNAVKLDSASRTVFSASDDNTVRLWDLDKRSVIKIFKGHVGQVQQVLPLPKEFDYDEEDSEPESDVHEDSPSDHDSNGGVVTPPPSVAEMAGNVTTSASPSPHGVPPRYMLTGSLDSTVRLWSVSTGKCLRTFFGHIEGVWALGADTLRVVSGSEDRTVKVWDTRSGRCERTFTGHTGPVTCIGLSDSRMCTGSEDSEVRMYSFENELEPSIEG